LDNSLIFIMNIDCVLTTAI